MNLITARTEGLTVEQLGDECLVFDAATNMAHALDPEGARVWRACDGRGDVASVAAHTGLSEQRTAVVVTELEALSLVSVSEQDHGLQSRRGALRKLAATGLGVGVGLPTVTSLLVPTAAQAFNSNGGMTGSTGTPSGGVGAQGPTQTGSPAPGSSPPPRSTTAPAPQQAPVPQQQVQSSHTGVGPSSRTPTPSGGPGPNQGQRPDTTGPAQTFIPNGLAPQGVMRTTALRSVSASSAAPASSSGTLPFTGLNLTAEAVLGAGVLGTGLLGRVLAGRRAQADASNSSTRPPSASGGSSGTA